MRPATQKEYLDRIRDDEAENYYKKTGYVPTEWAVMNFIAGFDKGAEEMAKIKDAQIEELVEALEVISERDQFYIKDKDYYAEMNCLKVLAEEALADHKRMVEEE